MAHGGARSKKVKDSSETFILEHSAVGEQQVAPTLRQVEDSIAASVVGVVPSAVGEGRESAVGEKAARRGREFSNCGLQEQRRPIAHNPALDTDTAVGRRWRDRNAMRRAV